MALPKFGGAAWNRLAVPWPACNATVAAPAQHTSVKHFSAVKKGCRHVTSILTNKLVLAEQSLLHSILYRFRYQMCRHRPYQSLKQVEQCLKRLNLMDLEKPIQDLIHLNPSNQKSENPTESLVPSQPVIEVVLMKILGGCKLLLRLLECCCTSFLLTVNHLHLQEYILLNTLVLGLLSRLWILYRSVLKNLSSLYKSLLGLLQEVSKMQPKSYIKGFAFPSDINEFLGTPASEMMKKMPKGFVIKKNGTGWMNRLFMVSKTASQSLALNSAAAPKRVRKKRKSSQNMIDIGTPVLVNRTNQGNELEFDIKALCRYPNSALHKNVKFKRSKSSSKSTSRLKLKSFVSKFQEARSFEELTNTLRTTILWCKTNRFRPEAFVLGMKLLKSRRLQHVEAQGCSLPRKLDCIKATLCKYLMLSSCARRPNKMLRTGRLQRRQRKLSKTRCISRRTPTDIPVFTKSGSSHPSDQYSTSTPKVLTAAATGSGNETTEEQVLVVGERNTAHIEKETAEHKDDIDDIFKAIDL